MGKKKALITKLRELIINPIRNDSFMVDRSVCVGDGKTIFWKSKLNEHLIGQWTFNDMFGLDSSGKSNHMNEAPMVGPEAG